MNAEFLRLYDWGLKEPPQNHETYNEIVRFSNNINVQGGKTTLPSGQGQATLPVQGGKRL